MLKDISAMANAFGGYILVGIKEEENGLPDRVLWMDDAVAEQKRDWILSCCISSIDPRIPGLRVGIIKVNSKGSLIKILVPRSTRAPHMVLKDDYRFYIRHDRQISRMCIEEIREACLRVENLQKNVNEFIKERKEEIRRTIKGKTAYVISSVPLAVGSTIVDINEKTIREFLKNPPGQRKDGWNLDFTRVKYGSPILPKPTLQGLVIGSLDWMKVELWRNGYYELLAAVDDRSRYLRKVFKTGKYIFEHLPLVELTVSYFRALNALTQLIGVEEPIISCVNIFNVSEIGFVYHIDEIGNISPDEVEYYNKPHLEVEPVAIYDQQNPDKVAKEFLGRIWNAFGFESEDIPYFQGGQFIPCKRNSL